MKANKLLTLVLAIILSTGFYGCGQSSEGGDPQQNNQLSQTSNFNGFGNFTNGQSIQNCNVEVTSFDQFRALVSTGNFPVEPYEFNYFLVQEYDVDVSTNELFGLDWLTYYTVDVDYVTQTQRFSRINSDVATHEEFGSSKSAILQALISIVNGATAYHPFPGTSFVQVRNATGDVYGIDLCQPLAANPIQTYRKDTGEFKVVSYFNSWPFQF